MGLGLTTRENSHTREIPELKALGGFSLARAPRGGTRTSFMSLLVNPDTIKNPCQIWIGFFLTLNTMPILVFYRPKNGTEVILFISACYVEVVVGEPIKDTYCVLAIHFFLEPRLLHM